MSIAHPDGRFIPNTYSISENARKAWSIENPLRELFTSDQLTILGVAVGALSQHDFTLSEEDRRKGIGSYLGLTNDEIAGVRETLLRGPDATLPENGLYVLNCALMELSLQDLRSPQLVGVQDPQARANIDRLKGRVLKLAGFHNDAVNELSHSEPSYNRR